MHIGPSTMNAYPSLIQPDEEAADEAVEPAAGKHRAVVGARERRHDPDTPQCAVFSVKPYRP